MNTFEIHKNRSTFQAYMISQVRTHMFALMLGPILKILVLAAIVIYLSYVYNNPIHPVVSETDTTLPSQVAKPVSATDVMPSQVTNPRVDAIHAALHRAFRIDQSCFDSKNGLWLIHATDVPKDELSWDEGWYYSTNSQLETIKLGNNTLSIINTDNVFNDEIWPDITGLNCKTYSSK